MTSRHLDRIFNPRSVAVIGASDEPSSVGFSVLKNLTGSGFAGEILPVNIRRSTVQGRRAWNRVSELPSPPDLAVLCTPARTVPGLVQECGAAGVGGLVILSAGFRELGDEGAELDRKLRETAAQFPAMRIIGPNCLGVIHPAHGLNASFAASTPRAGHVAFLSQSGALCTAVLDWAEQEGIGFSHFVSLGNMLDVDFADLIDYVGDDPQTQALVLYVESVQNAATFLSAARAFSRTRPIVAYKSGRFPESAVAAASHTGAMAGEDDVYGAAFRRAGIERVFEMDALFDCAELLARQRLPEGDRLAILTNAGGPGVMAADSLLAGGGRIAELAPATIEHLDTILPRGWPRRNPVDLLGDAPPERYAAALEIVLADPQVNGVLVILTPQSMTDPEGAALAISRTARGTKKPIIAAWMGGTSVRPGIERLNEQGIPTYPTPEHAVTAYLHLVSLRRNRETLYETPRAVALNLSPDRLQKREIAEAGAEAGRTVLSETSSKQLLSAYGIRVAETEIATSADEAVAAAGRLGLPVVLKVFSDAISHKTEADGVRLNLRSEAEIRTAYAQIFESARQRFPGARVDGVTVQPMLDTRAGVELIVGSKQDATFGAVILVGLGGTTAELLTDRVLELPPLNERLARRMVESLRSWPLLDGYRGRPKVDVEDLIETLLRFSAMVVESPEIVEFDINPLLVTPAGAIALDARAVIDRTAVKGRGRPYSHVAIRPWPEEFQQEVTLRSGERLIVRPIRPEDEPAWHSLLATCSPDSVRARFRGLVAAGSHSLATRFCFLDYDREMALVAEVPGSDPPVLAGVAHVIADAEHRTAELAVLVADGWQGRGIGTRLADRCLAVARAWQVETVTGETEWNNRRMIAIFRRLGFEISVDGDVVRVRRRLDDARGAG